MERGHLVGGRRDAEEGYDTNLALQGIESTALFDGSRAEPEAALPACANFRVSKCNSACNLSAINVDINCGPEAERRAVV